MLTSSIIMYSRSLSNDYRWIFYDKVLSESDKESFLNSYSLFEKDKEYYLQNQHLIMHKNEESISFYCFIKTNNTDQNSREIYALIGYVFSEFDLELVQKLYNYVVPFLFFQKDNLIVHTNEILDTQENDNKTIKISLDDVINKYKKDKTMREFSKTIYRFLDNNPNADCIVTSEKIELLPPLRNNINATQESFCEVNKTICSTRLLTSPSKVIKQDPAYIKSCSLKIVFENLKKIRPSK